MAQRSRMIGKTDRLQAFEGNDSAIRKVKKGIRTREHAIYNQHLEAEANELNKLNNLRGVYKIFGHKGSHKTVYRAPVPRRVSILRTS